MSGGVCFRPGTRVRQMEKPRREAEVRSAIGWLEFYFLFGRQRNQSSGGASSWSTRNSPLASTVTLK